VAGVVGVAAVAERVGVGSGAVAIGVGCGVGAGLGAGCVRSVFCASVATSVDGSFFGGSLAHPASAIDAAAVKATAMLPDGAIAARAQNGHDGSDA
jgi:hypothetical protein